MVLAELVGASPGIAHLREQVARLLGRGAEASRLPAILLQGETGTGKGLVARALHRLGPRRAGPFVDVNCAAIPEALLEAEMFGFERGAFTGAHRAKAGLFQAAHTGAIFLDEIGLLPAPLQAKFLKVLEERAVRRLGRTRSEPVDVWILAATSEDLAAATAAGRFRPDLYHRLAVVTLRLPPLRERGADVDLLADHVLARTCADYGLPAKSLAEDARAALHAFPWPGNVRELANVLERAVLLVDGPVLTAEDLGLAARPAPAAGVSAPAPDRRSLKSLLRHAERDRLLDVLEQTGWNLSHAAARLELPRPTLAYRMERHGLRPPPPSRRRPDPRAPAPAGHAAGAAGAAAPVGTGDRRRVSWLRAAAVVAEADDDEPDVSRLLELILEKVHTFGGHVEALAAARVDAAFGLEPIEDAPRRAALAALAILNFAERARVDGTAPWTVSLAIHVEDGTVTRVGDRLVLDPESSRAADARLGALLGAAPPSSVLVSGPAARGLERRFDLAPLLPADGAPPQVYRLTGRERTGFGPGERVTPFVGRHEELALLTSRLESVRSGHGHVVAIVGEAGIGKSRLLFEFRRTLDPRQVMYREGRCLPYAGAIPYLPVLDIVRQQWRITEWDRPESVADKVRLGLEALGMVPAEHGPYLLQLLGVSQEQELRGVNPELRKARTLDAFRQLMVRATRTRALVLVLEDLHWIDRASDELVAELAQVLPAAPVLLITTYRPGYQRAWLARSYVTQVALASLSGENSRAVLRSALGTTRVPLEIMDLLVARADGNPFFLEELAHAVDEPGGHGTALAVPDTIQGVLAARIDRLAPELKGVLQTAAVIGKDVPAVVLQALAGEPEAVLRERLFQLRLADFLYETRLSPELEYTFKHALTHEVAYASLTPERRRALHADVARELVRTCPETAAQRPEVVARHLTAAELSREAIPYWLQAGRSALRRSANVEAASHLQTAIALLRGEPDAPARDQQELELQLALGPALAMVQGHAAADAAEAYRRAETLCERAGDSVELFSALWGIWMFYLVRGEARRARATGERLLGVATRTGNSELLVEAHLALGVPLIYLGFLADARAHIETGLGLYDSERHADHKFVYGQDPLVGGLGFLAWALVLQGHEAEAVSCVERALGHAEAIGHDFSRALALYFAALVHEMRGDLRSVLAYAERAIAVAMEHRFPLWLSGGLCLRGRALAAEGRHGEGLALMSEGLRIWRATGAGSSVAYFLRLIADAYRTSGELELGLAAVAEAFGALRASEDHCGESELHRVHGELLAASAATSPRAEDAFRQAVSIARQLGLTLLARRAAASLAAYLRQRGRAAEADRVLAELDAAPAGDPAAR